MTWDLKYLPEAESDMKKLDHSQQILVRKALQKVKSNPLPQSEGGYGKPLGHKRGANLTGFLKIKLVREGIRVVYRLIRTETCMLVIVVGIREDDDAYEIAAKRIQSNVRQDS